MSHRPRLRRVVQEHLKPGDHAIQSPFIQEWLKEPGRLVTRRELYEFISRLERGRARAQRLHRRIGWVLRKLGLRVWSYLKRSPLETAAPEP